MIDYKQTILDNGLTVLAHRDKATQMAAVNILYKVGARDENPHRTGFAHLFEHLMFRGTKQIPDFDIPIQQACGENNAFTNNDYTDYYITLPIDNIETALWLESDRMTGLEINQEMFETEKRVVIEEYNQRYINQPYGDHWLLLRELCYKVHPYRWPTIGLSPEHIEGATLEEVRQFYERFYHPTNAILSIAGNIEEQKAFDLSEKWFGHLPGKLPVKHSLPQEPEQTEPRRRVVERNVPAASVTIAFHIGGRVSRQYFQSDLISDLLAGGNSARLSRRLIREKKLFSAINAYISNDIDPGLFIVTGHLLPSTTVEQAESAIWEELEQLCHDPASDYELEKVKNKFEAGINFGELNVMNKAMNLGYYNMLGDMDLLNSEASIFRSITKQEVMEASSSIFCKQNSNTLIYLPNNK